jgi:hypothetical protein
MDMWKYAVQLKQPVSNLDLSSVDVPNGRAFLMGLDVDINSQGLRYYEHSFAKSPETYRIMYARRLDLCGAMVGMILVRL